MYPYLKGGANIHSWELGEMVVKGDPAWHLDCKRRSLSGQTHFRKKYITQQRIWKVITPLDTTYLCKALGNPRGRILQSERCWKEAQEPAKIHAHRRGVGHLKGTDRLTNSPHTDPSPGQVLMKEGGRVLPPGLGGLEGDDPWSEFWLFEN